ncbi:MAG TPA: hypothetical protein VLB27_10420 [candidate division Zixibacteria bacterium]|nr:hypothetical protein [candidate division Zixibacteria bacterium]
MIGTSGAEALSRAAGDERLQRAQRTDNNPNRRQRRDSNRRQPGAEPAADTVEVAAAQQADGQGAAGEMSQTPEPAETSRATQKDESVQSQEESPHIDVRG